MEIISTVGFALAALFALTVIRQGRAELAPIMGLGVTAVIMGAVIANLYPTLDYIGTLIMSTGFGEHYSLLFRAFGIGMITECAADICRDGGEISLASRLEMLSRAEILLLSLPLVKSLLELAGELVFG